jgi:hypothetical protein
VSTPGDDLFADPYEVARDDEAIENVRFGTPPAGWVEQRLTDFRNDTHREPLPHVSGWIEDPREPSGWRWIENLAEMPPGTAHKVGPPQPYPTPRVWDGWADEDGTVYVRGHADEFENGGPA